MGSDPHSLMFLGVSVAVLLVGPGIHRVAAREPVTMAGLDNFVLVAIVGLVALEIVPGALQLAGLPALLALLFGALGPALADGPLHRAARGTHRTALVLAVLGMAIHSFTDGLALASAHIAGGRSHALEVAVIAHQMPVAVAVWWLLSPAGLLRASAAMLLLGVATVLGFLLADSSLQALAPAWLGILQGLFAGLLLHVVAHRTHTADPDLRSRVAASLGGLAGLGLLALLSRDTGHSHDGDPLTRVLLAVSELGRASAPALLLGLSLLGLLAAWAPAPRKSMRTSPLLQAAHGLALGVLRPVHARALLPELRTLAARGSPASTKLAYLIAAPTLGVDALLLSLPLLGGGLTLARGLGAVLLALLVGRIVGGRADHHRSEPGAPIPAPPPESTPLGRMFAALDAALPWLALGLLLAATLAPWLGPGAMASMPAWLQALTVVGVAAIGLPAHLCAAGITPVIAVLLAAGLSPGAGLAFLLTGPAVGIATQRLLTRTYGRRIGRMNLVLVFVVAVVLGLALDFTPAATLFAPALHDVLGADAHAHELHGDSPGLASDLALAALVGLMLFSLLRQTPQQFLRRLWVDDKAEPSHHHAEDADHHHHGHPPAGRWHTHRAHFSSRGPHTP